MERGVIIGHLQDRDQLAVDELLAESIHGNKSIIEHSMSIQPHYSELSLNWF
ncbi:hypothetical protein [Rhodohalobacter sp. 8-1]|uniref:hypothetical protein n=1 Tax=Rhodohalobacter sp. 8-1 TaxID=3131972 RepID=UPI0030EF4B33